MKRKKSREAGSGFVEFALAFLLILTLFGGAFEFGYACYSYDRLVNAAREGARFASLKPYDSATSTPSAAFLTAVQNIVVYGDPGASQSATPLLPGLSPSNVQLTVTANGTTPTRMTVSIASYSFDAIFKTMTFTGKPSVSFPYVGIPTPP